MAEHKYQAVARAIRGELGAPGSTLPSEADLLERFDVSRSTVRQALDLLEQEGLISSSQGNLRTVRDSRRWLWEMSTWEQRHRSEADAWAVTIQQQGGTPVSDVRVEFVKASREVAAALELNIGETVLARLRVRSVNGEPHQLSDSYFPPRVTKDNPIMIQPDDQSAPGGLLAASGFRQVRFHDSLTSRPPNQEEARILRMPPGTPLLVHARVGYDDEGRALRFMITRMAADRVEITYDIEAVTP